MKKLLKILIATAVVALTASCGGGGNSGTSPFGSGSTGTTGDTGTAAADLIVTLSTAQLANTGSATADVLVTAIDASRNAISGVPVTISADGNAVVAGTAKKTGTDGTVAAKVSTGSDRGNRLITITATSGSISKTVTLQVVGTTITSVLVPAVIGPSTAGQVQYHVVDQAGNPMSAQAVQIVAPGLTPAEQTGTTGANGDFIFNYTSPAATGSYAVTANIGGKSDSQTLQVQTTSTVPAVTTTITSASISANPSVVAVNPTGSESNRSEIRVLFLGANNLPVPNVRVKFDLNGDVNSIGGKFTTGTTTLYSDANGVVTTAYVPGTRSSPTDGVAIRACYGKTDTDANLLTCGTSKVATLTVTSEPLGVTIGTNEQIIVNELTYTKKFVVSVSDSAGVAKPDVNIVVSLDLPNYRKGQYVKGATTWVLSGAPVVCVNEDTNRNGVLETGEDVNNDGQLWPRKPDVIVSLLQSKTRADGTAELQITYAKDHGTWVDAFITVSASGVSGSEGRATYLIAPVPVDAASLAKLDSDPAYRFSPYGKAATCPDKN
ncbi:MAG: Ig-like domain-containing protein [Pseudomonadota bacterium]|nr:Ig-like domain-containing protein [Pseudomonadota bacterium]